jgi:hypothetical protein
MHPCDDAAPDAECPPTNIDDGGEGNGLTSYFFIGLLEGVFPDGRRPVTDRCEKVGLWADYQPKCGEAFGHLTLKIRQIGFGSNAGHD